MSVRSDFSLELQLKQILKETADPGVRAALTAARSHMGSGSGGHRRGGKILVNHLAEARQRAADAGEWHVVRLLQDSLDYTEGRILQPDFDERYRLFQEGARNKDLQRFTSSMLSTNYRFIAELGRKFLSERQNAGADDLLAYIESLRNDARFLDAPADRPGRYRLLRGRAETAVWLERVLRERVDIEDPAEAAHRIVTSPEAIALLAADRQGHMVLRAAELQRRAAGPATLRATAEDPTASEHARNRSGAAGGARLRRANMPRQDAG
jgi:hypothetical protein